MRVTIFGMEYTLKSEENPQFIVELANYLNEQMTEISERSSTNSALKIAILAALNITDDLFKERYEKDKLEKDIAEKCVSLQDQLDTAIDSSEQRETG